MERLEVTPLSGYDPVIGRWLWAMQEARKRTLALVANLPDELLDWGGPDGRENSIGSLLYHIAEAEMGWLWGDIKGYAQMPPEILVEFPFEPVDADTGRLSALTDIPLAEHVRRLERSRTVFLKEALNLALDDWQTPRRDAEDAGVEFTPEWALFHLIAHEMEHNEQISSLRSRWMSRM